MPNGVGWGISASILGAAALLAVVVVLVWDEKLPDIGQHFA